MAGAVHLWPTLKRWTVLTHLYLGVAFSALFVMWFVSGIVLMYSPYPVIHPAERLHAAPVLDCTRCTVTPRQALAVLGLDTTAATLRSMRLGMLGDRPVWRASDARRRVVAAYADTALIVPPLDAVAGARVATQFLRAHQPALPATVRTASASMQYEPDQWTLESPIPAQLPMLRYDFDDDAGTQLYVSTHGGEIVTGTTRSGRVWAWFGAVPHWIYPTLLRRHVAEWAWLVIILSALGTLMSVTGMAVGVWQWRFRTHRPRDGRPLARSPYRDTMMRWHHVTGFVFGLVTCTWIFSGMMSMNPGDWSPGTSPSRAVVDTWSPVVSLRALLDASPAAAWRALATTGTRELHLAAIGGAPQWLGVDGDGRGHLAAAGAPASLPDADVLRVAVASLGGAPLADSATLTAYDAYYRPAERRTPPLLPVLRLRFADADRTWLYVEPGTGRLLQSLASRSRLERWLYTGLHDLDLAVLLEHRPLWDLVVLLLAIGGTLASATGLVVAWRWLRVASGAPRSVRRR